MRRIIKRIKIWKFKTPKAVYEEEKNDRIPTMKEGYCVQIDDGHCLTSFCRPTWKEFKKSFIEEL
jgi:hypothetical protein